MPILANILGILAVVLFVFSYQLKSRRSLILFNIISRLLFVAQYLLLGAFEGALLDVMAFLVSILAFYRTKDFINKHLIVFIIISNLAIIVAGLSVYQSPVSLLPIVGVIFETLAFWLKKERAIRIVSLFAAPFWLVYNALALAYGSAIGNAITIVSITVAIIRYDILKKAPTSNIGSVCE